MEPYVFVESVALFLALLALAWATAQLTRRLAANVGAPPAAVTLGVAVAGHAISR